MASNLEAMASNLRASETTGQKRRILGLELGLAAQLFLGSPGPTAQVPCGSGELLGYGSHSNNCL